MMMRGLPPASRGALYPAKLFPPRRVEITTASSLLVGGFLRPSLKAARHHPPTVVRPCCRHPPPHRLHGLPEGAGGFAGQRKRNSCCRTEADRARRQQRGSF